jgi:DNA-binding transcriptional regulator YiaG
VEALALVLAAAALVVALVALGLLWRGWGAGADQRPSAARTTGIERRLAHLGQRFDVLEAEVDAWRRGADRPSGASMATARGTAAISRIGLVRFDAFEDAGGVQSFALALVDDDGDGLVLTSLHSRTTTRLYLKAVRRGVADAPLSVEEVRALRDAGITPTV